MVSVNQQNKGFTLIEILVVLSIIATLMSLVAPRYFESLHRAKETTLKHDLSVMRNALDQYYSDTNSYPDTLDELVTHKYLRAVPTDPITESSASWQFTPPLDINQKGAIFDIHSGSEKQAMDGTQYADW